MRRVCVKKMWTFSSACWSFYLCSRKVLPAGSSPLRRPRHPEQRPRPEEIPPRRPRHPVQGTGGAFPSPHHVSAAPLPPPPPRRACPSSSSPTSHSGPPPSLPAPRPLDLSLHQWIERSMACPGGGGGGGDRRRALAVTKGVLGLGFWVQGFRCFPWTGVNFYLKDALGASPSTLQLLQTSANLPMVGKPLYGLLSDAVYLRGQHRLPYIALGALLQAVSWLCIAVMPAAFVSIPTLMVFLLLGNLGASVAEVANDAIVAEAGRQPRGAGSSSSAHLQSLVWMYASSAGALGNLLGGVAVNRLSPRSMFFLFGVLLVVQFLVTVAIPERALNLPQKKGGAPSGPSSSIRKQVSELSSALQKPEIFYAICWFAASYAVVPILMGTMFYYQTQHLNLDPSVLGLSKVLGPVALLGWSVAYDKRLKRVPTRKLLSALQGTIALLMLSDVLFVGGFYRRMGVPDAAYVVIFSGLLEALFQFKVLPFSVLVAHLCPAGCEGSLTAFLMSAMALATIVSGYLGVALAAFAGVSGDNFSGLNKAILVEAACTLVPLVWSSWIPGDGTPEKKEE